MSRFAVARRNAILNTLIAPANSGLLRLYSGARPADSDTALSGNTLLATLTMSATSFVLTNGTLTANAIAADPSADASGTASFARLFQSDGTTPIVDFGVTTSAPSNGFELQLPTLVVTALQAVTASQLVITFGAGT
jgi:hypothetical protein